VSLWSMPALSNGNVGQILFPPAVFNSERAAVNYCHCFIEECLKGRDNVLSALNKRDT
ncbi:hypothetical protein ILYODFUR_034416, partial [Ilyodon furcidens]